MTHSLVLFFLISSLKKKLKDKMTEFQVNFMISLLDWSHYWLRSWVEWSVILIVDFTGKNPSRVPGGC